MRVIVKLMVKCSLQCEHCHPYIVEENAGLRIRLPGVPPMTLTFLEVWLQGTAKEQDS